MEINFSFEKIDIVAIYAAGLSTFIGGWEFFKWKHKNALKVTSNPNMLFIGNGDKNTYIVTNVINKGDTQTTITHYFMYYWKSRFHKFFQKKKHKAFIINSHEVPKTIQPGEHCLLQTLQNDEVVKMATEGYLCIGIIHTMGAKEILNRIVIEPKKSDKNSLT